MLPNVTPIVYIVDSDDSICNDLELLVKRLGWQPMAFSSASDFISFPKPNVPCCLILYLSLPDLNGLEVQKRLSVERSEIPIIFLTAHTDISTAVAAIKRGALELLVKPVDLDALLPTICLAIKRSEALLVRDSALQKLRADFDSLTAREREVMMLVVSGLVNKEVGSELGIAEITVKVHRANVMRKMNASSFAQLVTMASKLRVFSQFERQVSRRKQAEATMRQTYALL